MEHNHLRRIIGTSADGFYCKAGLLVQELLGRFAQGPCGAVSVTSSAAAQLTQNLGCTWGSDVKSAVLPREFPPSTLVFVRALVGFTTTLQFGH